MNLYRLCQKIFESLQKFRYGTLYQPSKMGNEQIIQVTARIEPQLEISQSFPPPQNQAIPEITTPDPALLQPQRLEPIPNTSNVEMVQASNPNTAFEEQQNFLAEIYNRSKQASLPNLKQKSGSHHRGSLMEKVKKTRLSNQLQVAAKMMSQGRGNKQNINFQRKPRSVVSGYQCTIEDCEDELFSSHHG